MGDKILVRATLYDSYGRPKRSGGDHLRGRMSNLGLKAHAPGTVFDHNNGSYTVIFEALWSGKAYISINLAYTREAITATYRLILTVSFAKLIIERYLFY